MRSTRIPKRFGGNKHLKFATDKPLAADIAVTAMRHGLPDTPAMPAGQAGEERRAPEGLQDLTKWQALHGHAINEPAPMKTPLPQGEAAFRLDENFAELIVILLLIVGHRGGELVVIFDHQVDIALVLDWRRRVLQRVVEIVEGFLLVLR